MDEHRRGGSCGKAVKGISVVSKGERGSSVGAERRKKQAIAAKDMLVIPTQPISSTENIIPFTPLHPPPHPNNKNTPTGRAHLLRFNHLNRSPALFQPTPLSPPPAIPLTLTTSLHLPQPHPPQPPPSPFASHRIYQTIKKSPRIHFSHDTNDKTASNSSSQIWKDCSAELRKGVIFGSSSVLIRVNEVPREGGCSPRRRLLEDAVSIVSHETGTVTESQICVDESILISREIDSFQAVSSRKLLPHCTMWLARERSIGWLVALKVFSGPQEPHAHHELSLLRKLNGEDPCTLQIYQTLVEGGRQSEIHFVMEPYEAALSDWLQKQRPALRCHPDKAKATLELCTREIQRILDRFSSFGIAPREKLWTSDFVWASGRLKLHSLVKMESVGVGRSWMGAGGVGELLEEVGRWLSAAS